MAGIAQGLYNTIVRRNTVFLGIIFVSAFGMQVGFDTLSERIWDGINRGRQWKDIKHKYMQAAEDDDDE